MFTFFVMGEASTVHGQADASRDLKVLQLVRDLQATQTQIADNQAKIDAKLADLAETIRLARINASRVGGKHIPPPKK
jgi:hypothetical protein